MKFYVGLHQPSDARHFRDGRSMVSVNRLRDRRSDFPVGEWVMDSGAFTQVSQHGCFPEPPIDYAERVVRWSRCGNMVAAVTQDYMCEPFILKKWGATVETHQHRTVLRYDRIRQHLPDAIYLMPVLQGYWPEEYVAHVRQYGDRLGNGQWVGVGSVCKRNVDVEEIEHVLVAIKKERPDLRLHGFGVKLTALESSVVRECLHSADSMAWSYAARRQGRDGNSWEEARAFARRIEGQRVRGRTYQPVMF